MNALKSFSSAAALAASTALIFLTASPAFAASGDTNTTNIGTIAATSTTFQLEGANILPASPTDFASASFYQTLKNLKADNANEVTLIIPLVQSTETSTDIGPSATTPTDSSLITAIQEAHSLGLTVTLKPHDEISDGNWRANIDATDRTTWFNNYENVLKHYAQIAQANNVEQIVLGTELIDMSSATHNATNTQNWDTLIAGIRSVYSGQLGYASNWGTGVDDEMDQIQFWDKLDFIGVDLYYAYAGGSETIPQMENELQAWNQSDLTLLQQRYNKPVEFTEVGYRSVEDANTQPFSWQLQGPVDDTDQANAYQALFLYWSKVSFIKGMSIWEWDSNPNGGGPTDTDYTPQGKPAEAILSAWYGGTGSSSTIQSALQPLQLTASVSATSTTPNTPIIITSQAQNVGNYSQTNVLIDTEVYNANGSRVYQNFMQGQTVSAGQTASFQNSWTPSSTGTYTVEEGVFSDDWSENLAWNSTAATISVQNQAAPSSPTTPAPVSTASLGATAANLTATVGTPATITAQVSNGNSGALSNVLIDTEVYDANGNKVFQNFASSQSFAAGEQKEYQSTYIPSTAGTYRIALGIFANDWSQNYFWINQAGIITASAAGSAPVTSPPPVATSTPPVATSTPPVVVPPVTPPVATSTPPVATSTSPVTTPVTPPPTSVSKNTGVISGSTSARAGTSVDFVGSMFGHEENVAVTVNGQTIATPHADGGGNFSTGSLSVPSTPGTYTYIFTGQNSGIVGTASVQVTP